MNFEILFVIVYGILGLAFGSFFAHLIYSKVFKHSPFESRSKCDSCGALIRWNDNIPVVSYLILRGKCRDCKTTISSGYFWIEFSTFLVFLIFSISFRKHFTILDTENIILIFVSIVVLSSLTYSSIYDIFFFEINEKVVLATIGFVLVLRLFTTSGNFIYDSYILAGLAGTSVFALAVILSRGKMGGGEIRYGLLMGLILGLKGFYVAFMLSLILAILGGIGIYIYKTCNIESKEVLNIRKIMVPLVPFLSFSTVFSYFYGEKIFKIIFKI